MPTKSDHPKLTNSKKDGKRPIPPPVCIEDKEVGLRYTREVDPARAFLGEVSRGSLGLGFGEGRGGKLMGLFFLFVFHHSGYLWRSASRIYRTSTRIPSPPPIRPDLLLHRADSPESTLTPNFPSTLPLPPPRLPLLLLILPIRTETGKTSHHSPSPKNNKMP